MKGLGGNKKCKYYSGCGSTDNCKRCDEIRKQYKEKKERKNA